MVGAVSEWCGALREWVGWCYEEWVVSGGCCEGVGSGWCGAVREWVVGVDTVVREWVGIVWQVKSLGMVL